MALIVRLLRGVLSVALKLLGLVMVLFVVHLLLARGIPRLREMSALLEREPSIRQELAESQQRFEREQQRGGRLEERLHALSEHKLRSLRQAAEHWQERLDELSQHRDELLLELDRLEKEKQEYCESYNPLKRWFCSEVEERLETATANLEPLLRKAEQEIESARASVHEVTDKLRVLGDEALPLSERLQQLGNDEADVLTLEVLESQRRRAEAERRVLELNQELDRVLDVSNSPLGWIVQEWQSVWPRLLVLGLVVLLLPTLHRVLAYFVWMPLFAHRAHPLRLREPAPNAKIRCSSSERSLPIQLEPGQVLRVRSEYARPVEGRARSQLLYRLRAPFVSYAAGLTLLTRVSAKESPARVTLAAPHDPDSYLLRIDLEAHPGITIHPRQLVGVIGDLELDTVWRPLSFHAWSTWQIRFILLSGTGSVVVEGHGDIVASKVDERAKIEQALVVGFDARLGYRTSRTETFLPYLLHKTPLVDDVFEGEGYYFWQKSLRKNHRNVVERGFDALFSAIGKLLGF